MSNDPEDKIITKYLKRQSHCCQTDLQDCRAMEVTGDATRAGKAAS